MDYNQIQKAFYSAEEAKAISWFGSKADSAKQAQALLDAGLNGDSNALFALSDLYAENDHPAHEIIKRIATGEGERSQQRRYDEPFWASNLSKTAGEYSNVPRTHIHLGRMPKNGGWTPSLELHYINHPLGHFYYVSMYDLGSSKIREFYLPTTKEQALEFADKMKEIDPSFTRSVNIVANKTHES